MVVLGHAHEGTNHADRDRCGDVGHPVAAAGRLQCVQPIADATPYVAHVVLDVTGSEGRADEAAQSGVDGRVQVDHRGSGVDHVLVDVVDLDVTDRRREGDRVTRHGHQVVQSGHRPEAGAPGSVRVSDQARGRPQVGECRVGDALVVGGRIRQIRSGHATHAGLVAFMAGSTCRREALAVRANRSRCAWLPPTWWQVAARPSRTSTAARWRPVR